MARISMLTTILILLCIGRPRAFAEAHVARTVDEIPFIGGSLQAPELQIKNIPTIEHTLVPGQTHEEMYLFWRYMEKEEDAWDFSALIESAEALKAKGVKLQVFPWTQYVPDWFKKTEHYVPLKELGTGATVDLLSPWAPGTLAAFDHFYAALRQYAGEHIDIISIGGPSSDYGEVGSVLAAPPFLPGGTMHPFYPQDPAAWHTGYWCGDKYALPHFQRWAIARYGALESVNRAWTTTYAATTDIAFPNPDTRAQHRRQWVDFMYWYQDSQTEVAAAVARIVRQYFPDIMLETKLGFANDTPMYGLDRTGLCRRMTEFAPFTIRSTHAATNRDGLNRAYYMYKRMAPVCHKYGLGFGTEPPGGDLTLDELRQQIFEDASAGVNYVFSYCQNMQLLPNTVEEFKRVLRPQERALVDIAVLYPTAQYLLDAKPDELAEMPFCGKVYEYTTHDAVDRKMTSDVMFRDYADYDVVDENTIAWGMLEDYGVLISPSGRVLEKSSIETIDRWIKAGGMLIVPRGVRWETVEGDTTVMDAWRAEPAQTAADGLCVFRRVDQGAVVEALCDSTDKLLWSVIQAIRQFAEILPDRAPPRGFDGQGDFFWETQFPSGWLVYEVARGYTTFRDDLGELHLYEKGGAIDIVPSLYETYFTTEWALKRLNWLGQAAYSFMELTEEVSDKKLLSNEDLERIGNTDWTTQHIGFPNQVSCVEGTLLKQDYELKKAELELAAIYAEDGKIPAQELDKAKQAYREAKDAMQAFWDRWHIVD